MLNPTPSSSPPSSSSPSSPTSPSGLEILYIWGTGFRAKKKSRSLKPKIWKKRGRKKISKTRRKGMKRKERGKVDKNTLGSIREEVKYYFADFSVRGYPPSIYRQSFRQRRNFFRQLYKVWAHKVYKPLEFSSLYFMGSYTSKASILYGLLYFKGSYILWLL